MKNYANLMTLFLLSLVCTTVFSQTTMKKMNKYNSLSQDIEIYINDQEKLGFKGVVLVAKNNKVLFNKPYGKEIKDTETKFWIGSLTKQFTATAIVKLQEEGKLSPLESIGKFIKNVPLDKKGITLQHLLTHTSGLGDNYPVDGIINRTEAINKILNQPLEYAIGEKYSYSSDGYNLLAIILEIVSNESYEDYLSSNLIIPAKLKNTGFWGFVNNNPTKIAALEKPEIIKNMPKNVFENGKSISNYGYKGATGIYSTTFDLYNWFKTLQKNKILIKKYTEELFQPHKLVRGDASNGVYYAYGWVLEYKNGKLFEIRHSGAEDEAVGHNSMLRYLENGYYIIVLSNTGVFNGEGRLNGVEWSTVLSIGIKDIIEKNN